MGLKIEMFIIILVSFVSLCASDGLDECKKIDVCRCSFSNGAAINLTPLGKSRDTSLTSALNNVTVFFHPCSDLPVGSSPGSACAEGASLCMYNRTSDTYFILGKSSDASFSTVGSNTVYLEYSHLGRSAAIKLLCDSGNNAGSFLLIDALNSSHVSLELKSHWVCPQLVLADVDAEPGMSTGSLLVILFFVFSLVYAGGGALALKFLRGASGKEMIPNYDFWVDLPFLCKDGLLFLLSGCKPLAAYDRI